MDKRILSGCIASLIGLMLFASVGFLLGSKLDQVWATPWGQLPLFDSAGIVLSMAAGGAIAGRRYVWFAVGLIALMWTAIVIVLVSIAPEMALAKVLHFNRLAIGSNLLLAGFGAWAGARLADRWQVRRAVA